VLRDRQLLTIDVDDVLEKARSVAKRVQARSLQT